MIGVAFAVFWKAVGWWLRRRRGFCSGTVLFWNIDLNNIMNNICISRGGGFEKNCRRSVDFVNYCSFQGRMRIYGNGGISL